MKAEAKIKSLPHAILSSADCFQNQLFWKKSFSNTIRVSILIRPYILSGLIRIQTICEGDQQKTLGGKELRSLALLDSSSMDESSKFPKS